MNSGRVTSKREVVPRQGLPTIQPEIYANDISSPDLALSVCPPQAVHFDFYGPDFQLKVQTDSAKKIKDVARQVIAASVATMLG